MKDPTTMWAAQAAEEQRRLAEAREPSQEERAEWADDRGGASGDRRRGRLETVAARVRKALGR